MVCRALIIRSNPKNLIAARDFSEQIAHECGFGERDVFDIKLAVSEALSNAILHGSPRGRRSIVKLVFLYDGGTLRITVKDEGAFGHWPNGSGSDSEGGRGLNLIALYMDEVSIKPSAFGTRVTLIKSRCQDDKACA